MKSRFPMRILIIYYPKFGQARCEGAAWTEETAVPQASVDPIVRLGEYWLRAEIMHDLLHAMREAYNGDLGKLYKDGHWWEFETFLSHWLSALFVVVEGFNKLKLKDSRVQKLFKEQLGYLKQLRHGTYHFSVNKAPLPEGLLNWAEELHEAIGKQVHERVVRKAHVERILEIRAKTRKKPAK
jgi:hypothetical protein